MDTNLRGGKRCYAQTLRNGAKCRRDAAAVHRNRWTCPPICPAVGEQIAETVHVTDPADHGLPGSGWTVPKLMAYVKQLLGHRPSRTKLRTLLKQHGLSWKKSRNVLGTYRYSLTVSFGCYCA